MANQVIHINRKKYAVGLFWQPLASGVQPRVYARTLSRNIDKRLNLFASFNGIIGLASHRAGARSSMVPAAAAVMTGLSEYASFLAAFNVGRDGFYVVAVRNGIILQDKLFQSEVDARTEYFKLFEIPDWGGFIAPSAWGAPRANERNISELLSGNSVVKLHSISLLRSRMFSGVLFLLFIIGIVYFYREPLRDLLAPRPQIANADPELVAEYKRQLEEKNKELDARFNIEKPSAPDPIVMPYDNLPDVKSRADVCFRAMAFLMQPISGWIQTNVSCGATHATVEYHRDFGTVGSFYSQATNIIRGAYVEAKSEDLIMARATLPEVELVSSVDERDAETAVRDIQTAFQGIGTNADIQVVTDTVTNGVDIAKFDVVEIAAASKLTPMRFMEIFDDFGGVYMTNCSWDARTRTWNYEVIIYVK